MSEKEPHKIRHATEPIVRHDGILVRILERLDHDSINVQVQFPEGGTVESGFTRSEIEGLGLGDFKIGLVELRWAYQVAVSEKFVGGLPRLLDERIRELTFGS